MENGHLKKWMDNVNTGLQKTGCKRLEVDGTGSGLY
jgi:hypothetical protein